MSILKFRPHHSHSFDYSPEKCFDVCSKGSPRSCSLHDVKEIYGVYTLLMTGDKFDPEDIGRALHLQSDSPGQYFLGAFNADRGR